MATHATLIVPAYKEVNNLDPLVRRVFAALKKNGGADKTTEIIIVDDNSQDGSVEVKHMRKYLCLRRKHTYKAINASSMCKHTPTHNRSWINYRMKVTTRGL